MKRALLVLACLLLPVRSWAAAPTFVSMSAIAANSGADITITLGTHAADDIIILLCWVRDTNDTMATPSGWTAVTGTPFDRGASSRYWLFWIRATSSSETNPTCDKDTLTGNHYGAAVVYRGAITTGDPFDTVGTPNTGTGDPAVLNPVTASVNEDLIIAAVGAEDDNNAATTTTATDPATFTDHYVESGIGADGAIVFAEGAQTTANNSGNVSVDWDTGAPVGWGGLVLAIKPPASTSTGEGWWGRRW